MNAEEAIKFLSALGYPTSEVRMHHHYQTKNWSLDELTDTFLITETEETTDEYFNSFSMTSDDAPAFEFRLLAVGRCFSLSKGQSMALRNRFNVQLSSQASIFDMTVTTKGYLSSITFKFPTVGKISQLHLNTDDLVAWYESSRVLDEGYAKKEAERKVTVGEKLDKMADDYLAKFGITY